MVTITQKRSELLRGRPDFSGWNLSQIAKFGLSLRWQVAFRQCESPFVNGNGHKFDLRRPFWRPASFRLEQCVPKLLFICIVYAG